MSQRCNSCTDSGEAKVDSHASSEKQLAKPHCFLTQSPLNLEASRTNVSEETPGDGVSVHCARPATGVVSARWEKDIPAAKPSPNPDDAGPIVCQPMGLPVVAGCDTAWTQTRISSGTACNWATQEAGVLSSTLTLHSILCRSMTKYNHNEMNFNPTL